MIQANDLRINNLVWAFDKDPIKVIVETIGYEGINLTADREGFIHYDYEFKELSGIPLTEEWLIRFGFEKCGNYQFKGGVFVIEKFHDDVNWNLRIKCGPNMSNHLCEILNVHHLQNIVYFISGQELTVSSDWDNLPFKD